MNRKKYYEEEQTLNKNPWVLVLLFGLSLGALLPLVFGICWQISHEIN